MLLETLAWPIAATSIPGYPDAPREELLVDQQFPVARSDERRSLPARRSHHQRE